MGESKKLILRVATKDDLAVLQYWDSKPHVIAASGADDIIDWETELACESDWQNILIAEVAGRSVGVVQIIDPAREETHYWGDVGANLRAIDIWIGEEDDLGRGFGTQMMRLAATKCFSEQNVTGILVDPLVSNTRSHNFYERLGFRRIGLRRFGNDDCVVYELQRHSRGSSSG